MGIGPIFIFVVIFIAYSMVHTCVRGMCQNKFTSRCCVRFMRRRNYINLIMVFLLEGCIEISITCLICFLLVSQTDEATPFDNPYF